VSDDTSLAGFYHPTHPLAARRMLARLPIDDHSKYTFVDLGSGKGLMLLLAAEHPYAAIRGVEFSRTLHEIAARNITTYRNPRQRCFDIASLNLDAREYEFPSTPLVVYLFNSFRHELLARVLLNLDASLGASPRDALVVYLNPLDAYLFDRLRHLEQMPLSLIDGSRVYRSTNHARSTS
jgi:SAM-dependent methyltransferase